MPPPKIDPVYKEELDTLEEHYLCTQGLLRSYIHKYETLETEVASNSTKLENIDTKLDAIADATQGLVDAWTTARNVHRFLKWLSGIGLIGVAITWALSKLPDNWF